MNELNQQTLTALPQASGLLPLLQLPEKVLQFGTGVLLRGLPDYFIDQANRQGLYGGRIVVVKSTSRGGADAFDRQQGLFTHLIRGIENGVRVETDIVNTSVSRVLSAATQWSDILAVAADPGLELVISNTTEAGLVYDAADNLHATPPRSFPGKLTALLHHRYQKLGGGPDAGLTIVPTELIPDNGRLLRDICLRLAEEQGLDRAFLGWLKNHNYFCSSLVDRIVPGKPAEAELRQHEARLGYRDELMIMSEPYGLWAIESADKGAIEALRFSRSHPGVVVAPDIERFRELKLRLLNGTHSLSCALAVLAGFKTVHEAMQDPDMESFIAGLMLDEISGLLSVSGISRSEAGAFGRQVLDRFRNPFIEHRWISITAQYTAKMNMRVVPLLQRGFQPGSAGTPWRMALGLAAFIELMTNGQDYPVDDPKRGRFSTLKQPDAEQLVAAVLSDGELWGSDLSGMPGLQPLVTHFVQRLRSEGAKALLRQPEPQPTQST